MEPILDEIRATFDCGIWYPVVSSVLMLPDACGAAQFWGQSKKPRDRYIEWYDSWVLPHFNSRHKFDGEVVYVVRNGMIHESTGFTRGKHGFDRVYFMPPNRDENQFEFCMMSSVDQQEVGFTVTIKGLMEAVELGVRNWLVDVRADPDKRREEAITKLVQLRPHGDPPCFIGIPVVS